MGLCGLRSVWFEDCVGFGGVVFGGYGIVGL